MECFNKCHVPTIELLGVFLMLVVHQCSLLNLGFGGFFYTDDTLEGLVYFQLSPLPTNPNMNNMASIPVCPSGHIGEKQANFQHHEEKGGGGRGETGKYREDRQMARVVIYATSFCHFYWAGFSTHCHRRISLSLSLYMCVPSAVSAVFAPIVVKQPPLLVAEGGSVTTAPEVNSRLAQLGLYQLGQLAAPFPDAWLYINL